MPCFWVSHTIDKWFESHDRCAQDWGALRKRAAAAQGSRAQRPSLRYAAHPNKLICEWEADDEVSIHASLTSELHAMAAIFSVDEVVHLDPAWLDDEARARVRSPR